MSPALVLDTNILVSAALKPGSDLARIVERVLLRQVPLHVCPTVVVEYREVLNRPKFRSKGLPRLLKVAQVGSHIFYRFGGHAGAAGMFHADVQPSEPAKAVDIIKKIEPSVVIPMHYKMNSSTMDIDNEKKFCSEIGSCPKEIVPKVNIKKKDLEGKNMEVILMGTE